MSEKDGLPDIDFYNIIEDTKQFIWLAADKGLYRYNGRTFDHFRHQNQKGNAVFGTQQDSEGNIWCNNIAGQFFFVKNDKLHLFIDLSEELKGELSEFLILKKELVVFTGRNIIRVNLSNKQTKKVLSSDISIGTITKTQEGFMYPKGNYIIETDKDLIIRDSLHLDIFDNYTYRSSISKRVKLSVGNQNICFYSRLGRNNFLIFDIKSKEYTQIEVPEKLATRLINHSFWYENEVWFSTDSGVFICEVLGKQLVLKKQFFSKKFITKIIQDQQRNVWLITKGNGINVIPNIHIYSHRKNKEVLNINHIERVDTNTIIFGTNDGKIGLFDIQKSQFKTLNQSTSRRVSNLKKLTSKPETLISKEDGVFRFNSKTFKLKRINARELWGAKSISVTKASQVVVSTYKEAKALDNNFDKKHILINKRSYSNHYSSLTHKTYIGTVDGLFVFDENFNKVEIRHNNRSILAKNIVEANNGIIWVATFNNGVYQIRKNEVQKPGKHDHGLLSNTISTIKNDGNDLWIASDQGVQYLNTSTQTFRNLTKENGIPTYRISDIETDDQSVFFSTNNGIFSIDKNKAFQNKKSTKVYITGVEIGSEKVDLKRNYQLKYNENSIRLSFNANGFQSFVQDKYQFRLLGLNNEWQIDDTNSNSVNYYNLPSGEYTFQVKSVLAEGEDSDNIDAIQFIIARPFWEMWWFYLGMFLFICLITYGVFQFKIQQVKKEQKQIIEQEKINKQLVLSQLENLRSQMNPHFIFNALNSIQEYIIFNEKELASSYLVKFSRLIRIYLDHSRENEVLLSKEIEALQIYLELEKNRFEDILKFSIQVDEKIDSEKIKTPSLFIQPYVENAIKHGLLHKEDDRKLAINFTLEKKSNILICEILDNGIGIVASKKINEKRNPLHNSFATTANQKRVELLNSNRDRKISVDIIDLTERESMGTKVIITIPL